MEHLNNISTIDNLAEFIISTNDNMRNNGMTGKSKGDLMKAVYGENYSNVDSALPLGLLEEMNINNDERWRYVMDYQNGSGGKLTDLINSLAEKNPYVIIYDEYEEIDNLPILSAMEEYKNSNYMFEFNYDYVDGSVEDYIDEKENQFANDEYEMRDMYGSDYKDIEYLGFLAIDESLRPHERLSYYLFEGEEFDRENLLKVAKMYPQAKEIYFGARIMGENAFGIEEDGYSEIDDIAMIFDMNKLKSKNMYGKGGLTYGKTDDVYFEVASLLDSKLRKHKAGMNGKEYIPKKTYGLESFKEFIKKYEDDERYEVDVPIELFTKESFNQYNSEDSKLRFIQGTIKLLGKDDLLKKLTTSKYLSSKEIDKINNKRIIQNAPEKTTIVKRIVSKQLLENGGNVNDYFAILTKQLESKYVDNYLAERFYISNIENGIEIITDEEDVFNEIKEDYANDILFVYPTFYQIEIKYSVENYNKLYNSYNVKADFREITDDRIVVKTDDLQTFEEIREDFNDGEILYVFPPMYKLEIGNFEEFTFEEVDSLLGETLDKYNYNSDAGKDNEDYLYELSKSFSKEDRDILIYALMQNKWSLPQGIRESVELKLLNRRNRKGNNDYKGDINDNDITYYNVGIDEGEDIGTRTLEFFDTKAEAQAFMDKFLLSNPNAKLFIDVEKRKVIGQQGNVIVNPKKVSSVVEDKIADFMKYVQRNTNFTTTSKSAEFDDLVLSFYSTLRDYIDEVFNDSPTEVESIEEIDFEDEIENFIIYFTSDEEKREELRNLMLDYLDDDNDTNEVTTGVFDNEDEINDIINTLRKMEVDGEKMQYILEQVGMEYQMLSQLIKTFSVEEVKNLLEERIDLDDDNDTNEEISNNNPRNEVTTNNLYRRLQFINEDINKVFKYAPKELLDFKVEGGEDIGRFLSDIEVASNLNDNESDDWKGSKINMAKGGGVDYLMQSKFNIAYIDVIGMNNGKEYDSWNLVTKILKKHNIKVDNSKEWGTKGYAEELYEDIDGVPHFTIRLNINDSDNPKELKKQLINLDLSMSFSSDEDEEDEYARGGVSGKKISVYNLRKGDKIKTRKGDIETIDRKIYSGYYTKENEYSHPFESIEFVERPNRKMANGGSIELANEKYLNSIPLDKKTRILQNIADHYGISEEQAYAEITDIESSALYEYITDQNLKMHVYQMMK